MSYEIRKILYHYECPKQECCSSSVYKCFRRAAITSFCRIKSFKRANASLTPVAALRRLAASSAAVVVCQIRASERQYCLLHFPTRLREIQKTGIAFWREKLCRRWRVQHHIINHRILAYTHRLQEVHPSPKHFPPRSPPRSTKTRLRPESAPQRDSARENCLQTQG